MKFAITIIGLFLICALMLVGCDAIPSENVIEENSKINVEENTPEVNEPTGEHTDNQTTEPREKYTDNHTTEPTEEEKAKQTNGATEPDATEPEATEPEATEPEATEPETTEPEATEPEETEPVNEIVHVTLESFDEEVLNSDRIVLVDFWATWCPPCQRLGPLLEEIAKENPQYKICKIDVDEEPELADRFNITSIPMMYIFKDGEVVSSHLGYIPKEQILEWLASN